MTKTPPPPPDGEQPVTDEDWDAAEKRAEQYDQNSTGSTQEPSMARLHDGVTPSPE